MAENSLNQLSILINEHIKSQEALSERLIKANALAQVAVGENFLDHSKPVIHSYLWELSDLVAYAQQLCDESLSTLLKSIPPDWRVVSG